VVGLGALLLADMGTPPRERVTLPIASDLPAAYRFVRDLPDDAIVYDQVDGPEPLGRAMYLQAYRAPTGYAGLEMRRATTSCASSSASAIAMRRSVSGWSPLSAADAAAAVRPDACQDRRRDAPDAHVVYRVAARRTRPAAIPSRR
jgi:hypothetical protein